MRLVWRLQTGCKPTLQPSPSRPGTPTTASGKLQVADGALSQVTTLLNRAVTLATESSRDVLTPPATRRCNPSSPPSRPKSIALAPTPRTTEPRFLRAAEQTCNQVTTAVANPAGLASAATGNLTVKAWDTTLAVPAYTVQTFTSATSDASSGTVAGLIENINNSGTGLFATLDNTGNVVVTDAQNRGTAAANPLADGGAHHAEDRH